MCGVGHPPFRRKACLGCGRNAAIGWRVANRMASRIEYLLLSFIIYSISIGMMYAWYGVHWSDVWVCEVGLAWYMLVRMGRARMHDIGATGWQG